MIFHSSSCKPLLPDFFCSTLIVTIVLRFTQAYITPTLLDAILVKAGSGKSRNGRGEWPLDQMYVLSALPAISSEFVNDVSVFKARASYRFGPLILTPDYKCAQRLVSILGAVSKNPNNLIVDQFNFEDISASSVYLTHHY